MNPTPSAAIPSLVSIQDLLFSAPLYTSFSLDPNTEATSTLVGRNGRETVDGYCPYCKNDSPFLVHGFSITEIDLKKINTRRACLSPLIRRAKEKPNAINQLLCRSKTPSHRRYVLERTALFVRSPEARG